MPTSSTSRGWWLWIVLGGTTVRASTVCRHLHHTFSDDFEGQLKAKWSEAPSTGFKVGIASGPILAKRVGLARHLDMQEPVWAGRPVNYAAKAAQQTDPGKTLVTGSCGMQSQTTTTLPSPAAAGKGSKAILLQYATMPGRSFDRYLVRGNTAAPKATAPTNPKAAPIQQSHSMLSSGGWGDIPA